jgi:hypothetical protein
MSGALGDDDIGGIESGGSESAYVAQLGRISGKLLQPNLTRSSNLSVRNGPSDPDLLVIDVINQRIGINTPAPTRDLDYPGYAKISGDVIVNGVKATIDNIIIGTDNIFRTTVGPISVETSDPATKFYHGQLLTDELDFNGQSIKSLNTNQSVILSASGTGKVELLANTTVTGNVEVTGNIRGRQNVQLNGQLIVGDNAADTIAINTDFRQGLIPGANNAYDLGSPLKKWDRIQLYGIDQVNSFVADGFTVSDQLRATGITNTISTIQSNDSVRIFADSGNIYLESLKIEDVTYYQPDSTGAILIFDGVDVVTAQGNGFSFNNDGTLVFVLSGSFLRQYPLSVAYDPSSIGDENSYTEINLAGLGGLNSSSGIGSIFFKPDGTRFYVGGRTSSTVHRIYQYDLSIAWNISTAAYSGQLGSLFLTTTSHRPWFSPDGTKLIVKAGATGNNFIYYELATAWNIAGGTTFSTSYAFSTASTNISLFAFNSDGTIIYTVSTLSGNPGEGFKIISLPTAFRPTGGTVLDIGSPEFLPVLVRDLKIYNNDFYIIGLDGNFSKLEITVNPVKVINQLNTPVIFQQTDRGYLRLVDNNGFLIPAGSSAQRQELEIGITRWNTEVEYLECWDGTVWQVATGGGAVVTEAAMEELGRLYSLILG